jgi:hypothetical protein
MSSRLAPTADRPPRTGAGVPIHMASATARAMLMR